MSVAELPRDGARPDPIAGEVLAQAYANYFDRVTEGQTSPETSDVLFAVHEAAQQIENGVGPFVLGALKAAVGFEDYFFECRAYDSVLSPTEIVRENRVRATLILWQPIRACSFSPVPIEDRRFMFAAAKAFGRDERFVIDAITSGMRELQADEDKSARLYGLLKKDIKAAAATARKSLGIKPWQYR